MKYSLKIAFALLAAGCILASCEEDEPGDTGFNVSSREITVDAVGGTERLRIESGGAWTANTEEPWIVVSPTNGTGSIDCQVRIDTTLLADDIREGVIRFTTDNGAEPIDVRVIQTGFEKMIALSATEVSLPSYGEFGKRTFDVELTANVGFKIDIPKDVQWMNVSDYDFELDRGSRPRTVKLRFNWENNTRPWGRDALVRFLPIEEETLARQDELTVNQEEAEEIQDNREGDSLAVVCCARSLNYSGIEEGESMEHWHCVTLWEPTDEGFTEDKRGRVRVVNFSMFYAKEGIPYEIQFLKKAEEIHIRTNASAWRWSFNSGEYIAELTQLKYLDLYSLGLTKLDDSFKKLVNLEKLDLGDNNFATIPAILTAENFPKLKYLEFSSNEATRFDYPNSFEKMLQWENLEYLTLSHNKLNGSLPSMASAPKYSQEEVDATIGTDKELPNGTNNAAGYTLVGKPKVLPNTKVFHINNNQFSGALPVWVLYHPYLMEWSPFQGIFSQNEPDGFNNVPDSSDYYFDAYPRN